MTLNKALFSSKTDLWSTPQDLFDKLDEEFHFETDVCALSENAKCKNYFTPEMNGLTQDWKDVCWMNPPYGNPEYPCKKNCKKKVCIKRGYHIYKYIPGIIDWVKKAYESSLNGATVVCLVPGRVDTVWWHEYCMKADEIRLIKGRLKFGTSNNAAPFPNTIVIFRDKPIYNHDEKPLVVGCDLG